MKSLFVTKKEQCYICNVITNTELHHIIFGKNRKKADEDGLTVYLCHNCHRGTNGIHGKNGHDKDIALKREAEFLWILKNNETVDKFIERYGKNYL